MRVLLVTFSEILPFALTKVLNPTLEYGAIVVDEPDISKKMFENIPQLRDKIFPFYDLKECIENFYYDFVLCVSDDRNAWNVNQRFIKYDLPKNKYVNVCLSSGTCNGFIKERTLRYYKEHVSDFEMFSTGVCYTGMGLDITKFKYKLFNFGRSGNDLYYDYQTAKFVLNICRGGVY